MTGAKYHYNRALKINPDFKEAFQFMHVPACHIKYSGIIGLDNAGNAGCFNRETITIMDNTESMIFCKDGNCRPVTPAEFLAIGEALNDAAAEEESLKNMAVTAKENSCQSTNDNDNVNDSGTVVSDSEKKEGKKTKKSSKKSKKGKSKKKQEDSKKVNTNKKGTGGEVEKTAKDESSGNEKVEHTVFMDRDQLKHGLPVGAVEIGTIAENELEDEDCGDYDNNDHRDDHEHEAGADDLMPLDKPMDHQVGIYRVSQKSGFFSNAIITYVRYDIKMFSDLMTELKVKSNNFMLILNKNTIDN